MIVGPGTHGLVLPDRHSEAYAAPQFVHPDQPFAATLSVWNNLESVAAFSYRNRHQEALGKRYNWFEKTEYPVYVAWWIDLPEVPSWSEAGERLERLHNDGVTSSAFDFKTPFDANGEPTKLDRPTLDRHAETVL